MPTPFSPTSRRRPHGAAAASLLAVALAGLLALAPTVASADALGDAKAAGLVGEKANGYLGVVPANAAADIHRLVDDINTRRRAEYARIAARNGIDISAVEQLAGGKAINRSSPGEWVDTGSGWQQR